MSAAALRDALAGPVLAAAEGLLGWALRSEIERRPVVVVLTEVEAYDGPDDPASHAYRGRTARNASMFAAPGTAYVYRSYGIHWCLNVATGPEGSGSAVLLRGGIVIEGEEVAVARRGRRDHLADGPGKLAQALGVTRDLVDGTSLLGGGPLTLGERATDLEGTVLATPRVGISKAADRPWRFVLARPLR